MRGPSERTVRRGRGGGRADADGDDVRDDATFLTAERGERGEQGRPMRGPIEVRVRRRRPKALQRRGQEDHHEDDDDDDDDDYDDNDDNDDGEEEKNPWAQGG